MDCATNPGVGKPKKGNDVMNDYYFYPYTGFEGRGECIHIRADSHAEAATKLISAIGAHLETNVDYYDARIGEDRTLVTVKVATQMTTTITKAELFNEEARVFEDIQL